MTEKEPVSKKDHIMDAAEVLFAENGFEGTSTRMIASSAQVNLAMVSYYFGGKEQLFQELVERKMSHVRLVLSNLLEAKASSWEKMETLIDLQVERMFNNRPFSCIIHRELSLNHRTELVGFITDAIYKNSLLIRSLINDGQKSGEFKKEVDVPMLMATLYGTISYIVNSPALCAKILEVDAASGELWDEKNKTRLKTHLKNIIKPALLNISK